MEEEESPYTVATLKVMALTNEHVYKLIYHKCTYKYFNTLAWDLTLHVPIVNRFLVNCPMYDSVDLHSSIV